MKTPPPPKAARQLVAWYSGQANIEDWLGDLDELFQHHCRTKGPFKARLLYWRHALSICFSYALRKRKRDVHRGPFASSSFSFDMLRNYFKVAVRNLAHHKYFTLLNAFGLAIGMSISLLLIAMFNFVRTYDNFHENGDHLYTVTTHRVQGIDDRHLASAPVGLVEKINQEYGGQAKAIEVRSGFYGEAVVGNNRVPVGGYFANDSFLSTFSFPLAHGQRGALLAQPNQLVLTEKAAHKIFGKTEVVGQTVEFFGLGLFEITAVLRDIPGNSHLMFEVLVPLVRLQSQPTASVTEQWSNYSQQYVYVNLKNDDPEKLQAYLHQLSGRLYSQQPVHVTFSLQHLYDIVTSEHNNAIGPKWELSGFIVFGVIAMLILLPACFNYTNIALARALKRSKEIGLRKTLGSMQRQIFFQFITETVVICLLALVGAIAFFIFLRNEFQSMLVVGSVLDLSITPGLAILFIGFALFTGLIAGLFPALYFARLNPVDAIKSKVSRKAFSGTRVRKGLAIVQFALSFCFILSIIVFARQYRTLLNIDFGFAKENILIIDLGDVKPELLKTELLKIPAVQSVSFSSGMPALSQERTWVHLDTDSLEVDQLFADREFLQQLNMKVLHGSVWPETSRGHEPGLLVNEQFARMAGLAPEDAVGHVIRVDSLDLPIVGVVRDFRYAPASYPLGAFVLRYQPVRFRQANAVVDITNLYSTWGAIEQAWKSLSTDPAFNATFFEDALDDSFNNYRLLLKMAGFLGLLAISISILGLLGMVVFTVETRLKEVSIRKVVGASSNAIIWLLSRDYLKLLLFSVLLGIPMAVGIYQTVFTRIPDYHADLTVWDVLGAVVGLLLLGFATIWSQTYKTALIKPAELLNRE